MADEKISQLGAVTTVDDNDLLVLVDGDTAATKKITGTNAKLAFGADETFAGLTDVTGAYTSANALYKTNTGIDGLEESTTLLTEPAANQFTLTRGTSAVVVQDDLTVSGASSVDQDLTIASASVRFERLGINDIAHPGIRLNSTNDSPTGFSAAFENSNITNTNDVVAIIQRGLGTAITIELKNVLNASQALKITQSGTGPTATFTGGSVGIGTTVPATSALLDLTSTTGCLRLNGMTTAQKNALTPLDGMILWDSTLSEFQKYENAAWSDFGTGSSNTFANLTDVTGAYTNAGALYNVNPFATGLEESPVLLNIPSANEFTLTYGTSLLDVLADLIVESDSRINQDLTTDSATVQFANVGIGTAAANHRLEIEQSGALYSPLFVHMNNTSSPFVGIDVLYDGQGEALQIISNNGSNTDPTIFILNTTSGSSARISASRSTSTATAVEINAQTLGKTLTVNNTRSTTTETAQEINHWGLGIALAVDSNNAANTASVCQLTGTTTGSVLDITQAGTGPAATFTDGTVIVNQSTLLNGLNVNLTNALTSSDGVNIQHDGTGTALLAYTNDTASTHVTAVVRNAGEGDGLSVIMAKVGATANSGITVLDNGSTGEGIKVRANDATGTLTGIKIENIGLGTALDIDSSNVAAVFPVMDIDHAGLGHVLDITHSGTSGSAFFAQITGASNSSVGLFLNHTGTGMGARIGITNATSTANAIYGLHQGLGVAGRFECSNASNTNDALKVTQAGTGNVATFTGGSVGIGTASPAASALLDLTSTTGALLLSRMTTTERDALTAVNGMIVYNSTTSKVNKYEAGAWSSFVDSYEEGVHTTTWSGIWASPVSGNFNYTKIGDVVTLTFPDITATANTAATITMTTALPANLRPSANMATPWYVFDNAINVQGRADFTAAGSILFAVGADFSNFIGSGTSGSRGWSISYSTV